MSEIAALTLPGPYQDQVLSAASDSGLTSLAQLAAFRLDCRRALISLYDRNFQYIVAEATQSLPLEPGILHPDLWLCGTGIPRSHGICEHVLIAPQGETLPVSVVPDLAEDNRFCQRSYIHNAPFNRFYAGVPIRSYKGINIGVLCVFDDKPHSGLDDVSKQYLRDLSGNIMSYLEARRVRDAASRHEKMVRGLGSFVEGPSHFSEVKQVFAKAANIIRESIDVDGVVFLDASIRSFGGLVDFNGIAAEGPLDSLSSASSGDEAMANTGISGERLYGSPFCSVLGFSTNNSSSLNHDSPDPGYAFVKEKFLRALLRRFPKGHIMNFDSDGLVLPGDSSSSEDDTAPAAASNVKTVSESSGHSTRSRGRTHQNWAAQASLLLKIFPGIRSLAVLPVWDASRERWYAGGFVYTTSSSRIFTSEVELGFLRTFGKAIQTELIQVETTFSEKAKSDALGSLSHELRSPLHGLLGACELLHDTRMSAFQRDMVRMAETSGRTLLDVIDHLLDYSKMSSIRGISDQSPSSSRKSASLGGFDAKSQHLTPIDVDLIVEEVVDSVYTGHNFQKVVTADISKQQSQTSLSSATQSPHSAEYSAHLRAAGSSIENGQVSVYLDIDHGHSWQMSAYPGAIRRIVMNLLGNSLKFTADGFIFVSLKQEAPTKSKRGADVVITIIDSGRGISEDFLQHQLFKPFSQEDKLSPGTGLGLNVVKQIVNMLQGHITVVSQPGLGTKTVVTIPLAYTTEPTPSASLFSSKVEVLKNQSVHLMGFENVLHTHFLSSRRMDERTLLARLCRDWFGMTLTKGPSWEAGSTLGILIADESCLEEIELLQSRGQAVCPVVVVCHSSVTAHDLSTNAKRLSQGSSLHFITQPIGPRKLAEAMIFSIEQYKQNAQALEAVAQQDVLTADSVCEAASSVLPDVSTSSDIVRDAESATQGPSPPTDVSASPSGFSDQATPVSMPSLALASSEKLVSEATLALATKDLVTKLQKVEVFPAESVSPTTEALRAEMRFLVVDDNKINVQILSSFLKKLKKVHSTAMDGLEALEAYKTSPGHFDYVFMDISMPRMDGLEATRRIRMFEREQKFPRPAKIIALTGLVSEDMQKEAFASGIDLFLTKPVKLQQLKDLIAQDGRNGGN
ncbi:uncharacterized protein B0I36DRAFT_425266 [Microdochium trichocladiopsis]|uniref:histidine kinase n=1 Tax=Microdochium trichocladiopsis TaxID=1682393 RepID=A0A9P9BJH5_9PEZI|nr:uncharacterized protein B0I36DRAFT_425266 [Microdochium trichocladiopsis]KAH7018153.1 hypothetical protein B0I36DRAFT_425266 [Microdochium trichocladiopsis]